MREPARFRLLGRTRTRFETPGLTIVDHTCIAGRMTPAEEIRAESPVLGFFRHGAAELRLDGRRIVMDPSQLVVTSGKTVYRARHVGCRGRGCATTLHLEEPFVRRLGERLSGPSRFRIGLQSPVLAVSPTLAYALHVMLAVTRTETMAPPAPQEFARACVNLVVALVLDGLRHSPSSGGNSWLQFSELARRAREALVQRATEGVSLSEIARELGCSRYHLCRVFKAEIGLTTGQYLHRIRVSEALHRLADKDEDLLTLAMDLGYSSHSHFTSVFRRHVGAPPSRVWARVWRREGMPETARELGKPVSSVVRCLLES